MIKKKILLLLSGGKDSANCVELLEQSGFEVKALCISGHQKIEAIEAQRTADKYGIELRIVQVNVFDELTWNPIKLIFRDLIMGSIMIYYSKKWKINVVATGVKKSDFDNPKLFWLKYFLRFSEYILKLFKIEMIYPLK